MNIFYPCNRHLLLGVLEEEEEENDEPRILLPEEYAPSVKEFEAYEVLEVSSDCSIPAVSGDIVLVENSMVREVNFEGATYTLILENYICGYAQDDEPYRS